MLRWLSLAVLALALSACGSHRDVPTPSLVAHASWTHDREGYRLHVTPSLAGRNRGAGYAGLALRQALQSAGVAPLPVTASIRDSLLNQLHCHAVFARRKPRWNLEAWRPDVGYLRTVAALCNP